MNLCRKEEMYCCEGDYWYRILDDLKTMEPSESEIMGYEGKDSNVIIPESLDGYPVTRIGEKAFYGNRVIRNVIMPDSMRVIGKQAFAECAQLYNVRLNEKLNMIRANAFENCGELRRILIPERTKVSGSAFFGCTDVEIFRWRIIGTFRNGKSMNIESWQEQFICKSSDG